MKASSGAVLAGLVAAAIAVPVAAQQGTGADKKARDPNEMFCEKSPVIGSRLATKKVCMTRAEWADRRLQDRQDVERAQTMRGTKGE